MAYVDIENVTSTILKKSYYETLATTELDTKKIDGETVVTEPVDVFIVTTAQIKVDELREIIDSRLIQQQDFAIRLHALSLALNKNTTNKQLYDALVQYDCHPAFVSVVIEIGKKAVLDTVELFKICRDEDEYEDEDICEEWLYDTALCRAAAENKLEVMEILKELGATKYHWALGSAARKGQLEAMTLLVGWGAKDYDWAMRMATEGKQSEAIELIEKWRAAAAETTNLLSEWGVREEAS